jgi:hypothetical protein
MPARLLDATARVPKESLMRVWPKRVALALVAGSVIVLTGCAASRQYFEPTERVTGQTENGYTQALYPLSGPRGPFGEATLWSRGAYQTDDGRTVVQIGVALHNTSDAPIVLQGSELRIGTMRTDDALLSELRAADAADLHVAAQSLGETQYHFVLPPGVDPSEVRAFRLRWTVASKDATYRQRTVFLEQQSREPYHSTFAAGYPCWPYGPYDCFYGPPYWGPHPPHFGHRQDFVPRSSDRTTVRPRK